MTINEYLEPFDLTNIKKFILNDKEIKFSELKREHGTDIITNISVSVRHKDIDKDDIEYIVDEEHLMLLETLDVLLPYQSSYMFITLSIKAYSQK